MSITPMWRVDRDGSMFTDKKAAEEHDRMLELADGITGMLEANFKIDEQLAEEIGLLLSRNKDILAKAFKGKPEILQEIKLESEPAENNTVDIREAIA
ncbi:YebG family protein [Endozoicomonas sp. GU-1]|uniref:YebG family protein n=1 Tax=unclassified Endozoicomonas TaxID=2644528 RepID=UPI0022B38B45|nr:YebG family protein [Endozoicomonas sp. GU-1]WBA83504.1 YebG family protein [Endozoicomonas sp. GU-1]WBA86438.1 YebG family protein [Endozoicomonas sp. GU-1]